MKFAVQWSIPQATFRPAVAKFLKGGGMPPAGSDVDLSLSWQRKRMGGRRDVRRQSVVRVGRRVV